ncbi:hypothetical protein BHE74_00023385 [Ensete ventricosum]|nr:hypothetical protein BHE74_00023385 [Ensete ventricosum]
MLPCRSRVVVEETAVSQRKFQPKIVKFGAVVSREEDEEKGVSNLETQQQKSDRIQRKIAAYMQFCRTEFAGKTCIVRYITGPTADRYADRPLPGGTAKIDRRRSISATPVGGRPQVVAARVARGFFLPHAGRPNVSPCGREFEATAIRNCAYRPVPVPCRYRQNVDTPVQTGMSILGSV